MIEAMKQALDHLMNLQPIIGNGLLSKHQLAFIDPHIDEAITALRTAIKEAEKQEPEAWRTRSQGEEHMTVKQVYEWVKTGHWSLREFREWIEATPPAEQREWVGLTDEEIDEAERLAHIRHQKHRYSIRGQQITPADDPQWHYARAIEAKLKEKHHDC
jgi:hypothetical protein